MSTGSLEARLAVNVEQFVANMVAAGNVTQTQADRMARLLKSVQSELKQMNAASAEAAKSPAGIEASAKAMEHVGFATAGAKRELLVLVHEASQGNWKQFAGSLMVLGERTNAMELAFSGAGLAIGVAAGAVVGFTALAVHGALQQSEFNKQLLLTGNYAGQTAGSIDAMSRNVAATTNITVRAARDALAAVAASGAFGPANLQQAGVAVQRLASLTGEETEKIVADFAKMRDGVAKWAAEHNRSMHFISSAQVEAIRQMEQAGRTEEAQQQVLAALNGRLAESEKNLGTFARAWLAVKKAASDAGDAIEGIGRGATLEQQIAKLEPKVKELESLTRRFNAPGADFLDRFFGANTGRQLADMQSALDALRQAKKLSDDVAKAQADSARRQEQGIAGRDTLRRITDEVDKRSELTRKLEEYRTAVERVRAAEGQGAITAQQEAETIAKIRERYADPNAKKLETELQSLLKTYQDEAVKLQAQTEYYRKYGKQLDDAREAVARFRLTQGDLKGATAQQAAPILAAARIADEQQQAKAMAEADEALRRRIDALWELTRAQQVSAREAFIQQRIEQEMPKEFQKGTEAYEARARAIRDAANAGFTATTLRDATLGITLQGDGTVQRIREETDALGRGSLARQQVLDRLQLEAKYREQLKKVAGNPEDEARLQAELAIQIAKVNSAREEGYNKAREWSTGVNTAVQKFIEDATNQAANASSLVNGFLRRSEDALINFARTGKLSFRDLFSFMAEEFLRQQIRMQGAKLLGGLTTSIGGGNLLADIGYVFGLGGFKLANGKDYVPYDGYPASLHEGEMVLTKGQAQDYRSGSGGPSISVGAGQVIHIGQGVSRAEVMSAINAANRQSEARIQRGLRQGTFA